MNADGHLTKYKQLTQSFIELSTKDPDVHIPAIIEIMYGRAMHLIAYIMEGRSGLHSDIHQGTSKLLREHDEDEIAVLFDRLDILRHGRWYGGKGNGETLDEAKDIMQEILRWADL